MGETMQWLLKKSLDTFHTFLMVLRSNLHRGIKLVHVLDIDFWIRTSLANWGRLLYLPLLLLPCLCPYASNLSSDPGDSCPFRWFSNWVINQAIYSTQHNITSSIPRIRLFIILIVSAISVIFFYLHHFQWNIFISSSTSNIILYYCISVNFVMTFYTPPSSAWPNTSPTPSSSVYFHL